MNLDIKRAALVGAHISRQKEMRDPTIRRCEGCRERIVLSKSAYRDAIAQASRAGKSICIVCMRCAKPWMEDLVRNGGEAVADATVMRDELIPELGKIRSEQIESN